MKKQCQEKQLQVLTKEIEEQLAKKYPWTTVGERLLAYKVDVLSIEKQICLRCGYEFFPSPERDPKERSKIIGIILPKTCPDYACRSPYWMKPRQVKGAKND